MRTISEIQGKHLPNNGEGLTVEDLYQFLKSLPARVRRDTYVTHEGTDVIGLHFGQRDQAESSEFSCHIVLDKPVSPEWAESTAWLRKNKHRLKPDSTR